MGFLYRDTCHSTLESAKADTCGQHSLETLVSTNVYTSNCTQTTFTGTTYSVCKRTNAGTCTNVNIPYPTYQTCDEFSPFPSSLGLTEGALIAGAVLAVWAVGYGFRALIRTLNIDSNSSTSETET